MVRIYRRISGTRHEESSTHVNRMNLICVPAQSEEPQVRKNLANSQRISVLNLEIMVEVEICQTVSSKIVSS